MRQIVAEGLVKTYRVSERPSCSWGALRGVFSRRVRELRALDQVSFFSIEQGELVGYVGQTAPASRPPSRFSQAF